MLAAQAAAADGSWGGPPQVAGHPFFAAHPHQITNSVGESLLPASRTFRVLCPAPGDLHPESGCRPVEGGPAGLACARASPLPALLCPPHPAPSFFPQHHLKNKSSRLPPQCCFKTVVTANNRIWTCWMGQGLAASQLRPWAARQLPPRHQHKLPVFSLEAGAGPRLAGSTIGFELFTLPAVQS